MRRKVVSVTKLVAVEVYGFTLILRNSMQGVLVSKTFGADLKQYSEIYCVHYGGRWWKWLTDVKTSSR